MKKTLLIALLFAIFQLKPCTYDPACKFEQFGPYDELDIVEMIMHEYSHEKPEFVKCMQDLSQKKKNSQKNPLLECLTALNLQKDIQKRWKRINTQYDLKLKND